MRSHPGIRFARKSGAIGAGIALFWACCAPSIAYSQVYWTLPVSGAGNNGDWFAAANWTLVAPPENLAGTGGSGPPTATETAFVGNAPAATVAGPGAVANQLIIDQGIGQTEFVPTATSGQVIVTGAGVLTLLGNALPPVPPPE
jgi:hypothetical protein